MSGFLWISARRNVITGERVPVCAEIHEEDLEWLQRLWEEGDLLAYEILRTLPSRLSGTDRDTTDRKCEHGF